MNKETIKKANELTSEIERFKEHKKDLNDVLSDGGFDGMKIVPTHTNRDTRSLRTKILPLSVDNFMSMYMLNLDKKIAELEKELEQL